MKKAARWLRDYPLLAAFAVFMGGLFLLDLCFAAKPYSELENRKLKQRPAFTLEALWKNEYAKSYESYINDQFVGRDGWITLKSVCESALGKVENNGVVYGADGYIFNKLLPSGLAEDRPNGAGFGGDGEDAAALPVLDEAQLTRNTNFLLDFLGHYDGHVTLAIAPNSYAVLEEKLPAFLPVVYQREAIRSLRISAEGMGATALDLFPPLEEAARERQVYYRTDHHWTTDGAWTAYAAYAQSRGLAYASLEELAPLRREEPGFLGTYYNKAKNFNVRPDTLVWYDIPVEDVTIDGGREALESDGSTVPVEGLYQKEKFDVRDKYAAFLYGNHGLTVIRSGLNKNRRDGRTSRVLVIKDSYGNCFAPFLAYSYDEVWVADLRNLTFRVGEVVADNEFDDVLVLYNFDTFQSDKNLARLKMS